MAISFDMSNYRSDFMISDAAFPQRVETQIDKEQTSQFAQILKDLGSTSAEPAVTEVTAPDRVSDVGSMTDKTAVPGTVTVEQVQDSEGMDALPDDPKELARMILRGDIDIDDVPAEKITVELLKALAVVAKTEKLKENDDEDNGKEEKDFFVPGANDASKGLEAVTLLDQILAILYKFIDAYTETRYDDEKEVIGGIEELLSDFPEIVELYSALEENIDNGNDTLEAHIAKMLVEQATEEPEEQPENIDVFVKSDELPVETAKVETEQPDFAEEVIKAIGEEKTVLLDDAAKNGELGEVKVEQKTEPKVEVKAEFKPEVRPETKVEVKQTDNTAPEKQLPVENTAKQPVVKTDEAADRAKAISEELEMLRNARLNKNAAQPVVEEKTTEEKQSTPIPAANPLETDSPIVFTRRDGSEITVRPSDVVAQAAKLVETAITEGNKEQTEYSLVLNPEELGKITVKLVKAADGAISVTIAAENARTQRILDQNSHLMQSNLRDDGIRLESWQVVRESQQETLAQDYNGSSKNPYYREDTPQQEEDEDQKSFADIIAAM